MNWWRCLASGLFAATLLAASPAGAETPGAETPGVETPGAKTAGAELPRTAVFGFELLDTGPLGGSNSQSTNPDDQARLHRLDAQLLQLLARSGRYAPEAVAVDPTAQALRTCDGCEVDLARAAGAQISVIGWVQKVSNLILNINLVLRDVKTGERIAAGSVDIRGDNDESWTRGLAYLMRNRILVGGVATP